MKCLDIQIKERHLQSRRFNLIFKSSSSLLIFITDWKYEQIHHVGRFRVITTWSPEENLEIQLKRRLWKYIYFFWLNHLILYIILNTNYFLEIKFRILEHHLDANANSIENQEARFLEICNESNSAYSYILIIQKWNISKECKFYNLF